MKESNRPSALERLSTAINSSDLTVDADHRTDADYIISLGIAGSRHSKVASPMMRLHLSGTNTSLKAAFDAVLSLVKRINAKRNWRLNGQSLTAVSLQALSHHVSPTCTCCKGRKFELQDGTPVLSTKPCRVCGGSGRRPVQKKFREEINHVVTALESIDDVTERAVARLVR